MSNLHSPDWVDYVAALVHASESTAHEIGCRVWELSTYEEILDYLTGLMTENAMNTRAFEVAWDVWALISGRMAS